MAAATSTAVHRSVRRHHRRRRAPIRSSLVAGFHVFGRLPPCGTCYSVPNICSLRPIAPATAPGAYGAWGQAQKFELLIARGAAPGTLVPVLSCLWEFGTDRPALHRRNTSGASPTRRDGRMGVKCPGPIAGTGLMGRVFAIAFAELFCGLARKRSSRF